MLAIPVRKTIPSVYHVARIRKRTRRRMLVVCCSSLRSISQLRGLRLPLPHPGPTQEVSDAARRGHLKCRQRACFGLQDGGNMPGAPQDQPIRWILVGQDGPHTHQRTPHPQRPCVHGSFAIQSRRQQTCWRRP